MKLQIVFSLDDEPDEIIAIAPFRDKMLIATRERLLLMEHDEETTVKLQQLARLHNLEIV